MNAYKRYSVIILGSPRTAVNGPNNQNFDLNKSRQKFHHRLKEHHKISNIPKFRCEML
jgi:nicotinamide riboside kinase